MLVPHFCRACPSLADAKQLGGWPEWFMWSWSQAPETVGRVAAADGPGPYRTPAQRLERNGSRLDRAQTHFCRAPHFFAEATEGRGARTKCFLVTVVLEQRTAFRGRN